MISPRRQQTPTELAACGSLHPLRLVAESGGHSVGSDLQRRIVAARADIYADVLDGAARRDLSWLRAELASRGIDSLAADVLRASVGGAA
jgi:hypothetical protein